MLNILISEYLVLLLLIPVTCRFFFQKSTTSDVFSVLSPFSIIICILQIAAYGFNLSNSLLLILSILVFFTNIRSFFRFCSGLYFDWFSLGYRIISIFELILICCLGVFFWILKPIPSQNDSISCLTTKYAGSSARGYSEKLNFFEQADFILYRYEKKQPENNSIASASENIVNPNSLQDTTTASPKPPILYLQDPRTKTSDCIFTIQALAQRGFTVYSADYNPTFYSSTIPFLLRLASYFLPKVFTENYDAILSLQRQNMEFLLSIISNETVENTPDGYFVPKIFIVSDGLAKQNAIIFKDENPTLISSFYQIDFSDDDKDGFSTFNSIPSYIDGYGNVPLLHQDEIPFLAGKINKASRGIPSLIAAEVETAALYAESNSKLLDTSTNKNDTPIETMVKN